MAEKTTLTKADIVLIIITTLVVVGIIFFIWTIFNTDPMDTSIM